MSDITQSSEPTSNPPISPQVGAAQDLRLAIEQSALDLPVLPAVALEVLASSVDEQANAKRLAQLIQQDQSLSSHVLRVVNTPIFRGSNEIVALQQAIARLGMSRIREIALTASVGEAVFKTSGYKHLSDAAWKKALATGLWAKEVARTLRKNVETAYLCGLLHNIGVPLILQFVDKCHPELDGVAVLKLIEEFVQPAGVMLVNDWHLPEITALIIAHLHDYQSAPEAVDEVAIVLAGILLTEVEDPEIDSVEGESVFHFLNLYPEDLATLLVQRETIAATVESLS